jgi:DNA-binding transcriptional LysR family regulator
MTFDGRLLPGIGVLAQVVETGNFARAGEALGLTPSGVSRAVARLEARLGVRLFDRTPQAVRLTEEGRLFYAQVAPLLTGLEDAAADASSTAGKVRGRLRVNCDPWFGRLVLAPRLPIFLERHPDLSLEIIVRDTPGDLVAEGIDVAVRFGEVGPPGLVARKLLDTRILAVAAPSYLKQHGIPRKPADLSHHECLLFRDPVSGKPFEWEFRRKGEVVEVAATGRVVFNDLQSKLGACVAGQGIAQSVAFGLEPLLGSGQLVQVLSDWSEETYALYVYYPSRYLPPAKVRALIDFLLESVPKNRAARIPR